MTVAMLTKFLRVQQRCQGVPGLLGTRVTTATASANATWSSPWRGEKGHRAQQQFTRLLSAEVAASSKGGSQSSGESETGGRFNWAGTLLLLPAGITAFLGVWQVQRRQWKLDMIAERQKMLWQEPTDIFALECGVLEYLPVKAKGKLLHDKTIYIGPRVKSSMGSAVSGHTVITPLHSDLWHKTVLVNRGWAPSGWRSGMEGDPAAGAGQVELSGALRLSDQPCSFVPDNKPAAGQWHWIDVPAIAEACGLPADTPMLEVYDTRDGPDTSSPAPPTPMDVLARRKQMKGASQPEVYPQPKPMGDLIELKVMPKDHLNYAATWFSLSGITAAMAIKILTTKKRSRRL
mmetsp:Transcript_21290/g.59172  ORF Transcript_21290/g.59172 Transcript_21290/m.59172 type:complete len:347 (+) Transcript_21290:198-1238(+)